MDSSEERSLSNKPIRNYNTDKTVKGRCRKPFTLMKFVTTSEYCLLSPQVAADFALRSHRVPLSLWTPSLPSPALMSVTADAAPGSTQDTTLSTLLRQVQTRTSQIPRTSHSVSYSRSQPLDKNQDLATITKLDFLVKSLDEVIGDPPRGIEQNAANYSLCWKRPEVSSSNKTSTWRSKWPLRTRQLARRSDLNDPHLIKNRDAKKPYCAFHQRNGFHSSVECRIYDIAERLIERIKELRCCYRCV
uniref:Uncharacterized protein n=1 Tax=Steinernema glaseri TaxID=37863 RepID=A0A1I8AAJ5_9BILA